MCRYSPLLVGPVSPPELHQFSFRGIDDCLKTHSPHLYLLLQKLISSGDRREEAEDSVRMKTAVAESVLLKQRDPRASGMQLLTTFKLIAKGNSKDVLTHLNHMGICMSYRQAWRRLQTIADDPDRLKQFEGRQCLWVYDNFNLFGGVHHERQGSESGHRVNRYITS